MMKKITMLLLLCMMNAGTVKAEGEMSFRGTLLDTVPCELNDGEPLAVDFGEVGINKIDGQRYMQTFSFAIHCPGGFDTPFRLLYLGEASGFDPAVLKASSDGLGIKLRNECGSSYCDVEVGGFIPVKMEGQENSQQKFQTVPVKQPGATLNAGPFNASASFRLEYY
ncbi:fimbrial protein [Enterobacter cloacae]